jgi:hypothetical protein
MSRADAFQTAMLSRDPEIMAATLAPDVTFTAHVGGRDVEGIDALRFDAAGQVRELVVMIRPHSALTAVMEAMARRLGAPPA